MDQISNYSWGAPLAVTSETVIAEYEIPGPNAVREALFLGEPRQLWVADVATNRMFKLDPVNGHATPLEIPSDGPTGPHSLHRGADGSLWVAPFFSSVVAQLDVENETWKTWDMKTIDGQATGIHDLSFGSDHVLLKDKLGQIWFSDIANNAVGYIDPSDGRIENYVTPDVSGRTDKRALLYGLVMTSDREHIWYSQLGIGSFGSFNVVTRKFETSVQLPANTGPQGGHGGCAGGKNNSGRWR
jgi:streptogramin lyase